MLKTLTCSAILALATSMTLMADAVPYPGTGSIAQAQSFQAAASGDVIAYFYGGQATFSETLGLFVNGVQEGAWGLQNHSSAFGQVLNFGPVQAGDSLIFALNVTDTRYILYSDPALNPDGIDHAYATPFPDGGSGIIPQGTFVGFEDSLLDFSDLNYNDETFVFTNVASAATATPEPASMLLVSAGILAAGFKVSKKRLE